MALNTAGCDMMAGMSSIGDRSWIMLWYRIDNNRDSNIKLMLMVKVTVVQLMTCLVMVGSGLGFTLLVVVGHKCMAFPRCTSRALPWDPLSHASALHCTTWPKSCHVSSPPGRKLPPHDEELSSICKKQQDCGDGSRLRTKWWALMSPTYFHRYQLMQPSKL